MMEKVRSRAHRRLAHSQSLDSMNFTDLSSRLAAALLVRQGELSIVDIRALPFVDDDETAALIADDLGRIFNVDIVQRRSPVGFGWEDVLQLRELNDQNA